MAHPNFPTIRNFPFGITDPEVQIRMMVCDLKAMAEKALQHQDYARALEGYTHALNMSCESSSTVDEIPKILCNRSMVFMKIGKYKEALEDATNSIREFPYWIKGYWRASQAMKELGNPTQAVVILHDGLKACGVYMSPLEDNVTLFTEMVSVLCRLRGASVFTELHEPRENFTKVKIIQRLVSSKQWEEVCYLVTGEHSGDNVDLAESFSDLNFAFLPVGNLLKETSIQQQINWGIHLAITLLKKGASFQQMEFSMGMAAIHIGVQTALQTGSVEFLKFLLASYIDSSVKKDMIDKKGDSAIHVVVKSGKSNGTLGETILRLLINHGCTPDMKDISGKIPIDYLKTTDQGYTILQASKANREEEILKKILVFKTDGNKALKERKHGQAIQMYTKGLELCGDNTVFKREAAKLLSNRSNVYNNMTQNREALKDAEESIRSDSTWFKGYWRKGQELKRLGNVSEAYTTFMDMFKVCFDVNPEDKVNFMTEAAILFKDIPDGQKREKYKLLSLGDRDLWTNILVKLSRSADWLTIRYLVMGMTTEVPRDQTSRGEGVAALANTDKLSYGTVFDFLKTVKFMSITVGWLTPTLIVLLFKHGENFLNFTSDATDTCLHAAVRYSLITGSLALLEIMPLSGTPFLNEYLNGKRETPFHVITKYKHTEDLALMIRVSKMLIEKKFTASMKDKDGKLAIDFVSEGNQKPLYDVLTKVTWKVMPKPSRTTQTSEKLPKDSNNSSLPVKDGTQPRAEPTQCPPKNSGDHQVKKKPENVPIDPMALKEIGNEVFKKGDYLQALIHYTKAIDAQKARTKTLNEQSRDLAILYGNRVEAFLKIGEFDKAMEDAMESVSYDGHWFKAHMKIGKVLAAIGNSEGALQAYTNAMKELSNEPSPEPSQRQILTYFCEHYVILQYPVDKKVTDFTVPTYLWALVSYDLISKGNWDIAFFPFIQFKSEPISLKTSEKIDFQPMCVLEMVKKHGWCLDLIEFFLVCGSDHKTLKTRAGDMYIHASVKLTIASGSFDHLQYILSKIVRPNREQNLLDDKGNTALHTVAKDREVDIMARIRIIIMLLEAEVNPLIKNLEGKYAIFYVPKNEFKTVEILHGVMQQQEDMERKIKQQMRYQKQQEIPKSQSQPSTSTTAKGGQPPQNVKKQYDSWKQSYMPKPQPTPKQPSDKCRRCDEVLEECRQTIKTKTSYAYAKMATTIRENNHNKDRHLKIVDEMLKMITESLAKTLNPEIPERLAKIAYKYYNRIVNGLIAGENWRQLDIVVDEHRKHHGPGALADYAKDIKLPRVIIHSSLKGSSQLLIKIMESMLKSGAVMDNEGKRCIQAAVQEEQYKVLETLFKHGACPSHLSVNPGDTPIHAALSIAVERDRGNFSIFNLFLTMFESDQEKYFMLDPTQQDKHGDSLFHLVAKMKYNSTVQKATEILCDKKISSNVKNNEGKLPIHYLNLKNDRRLQFFRLASVGGPTKVTSKKPKSTQNKKKDKSDLTDKSGSEEPVDMTEAEENDLQQYERPDDAPQQTQEVEKPVVKPTLRKEALRRRIEELIYGLEDVAYSKYSSRIEELEKPAKKSKLEKQEPQVKETVVEEREPDPIQYSDPDDESEEGESVEEHYQFDPQVFENLEWEVECTADVWKALRDKHVLPELKQKIVCRIQHLAAGEWTHVICKKLHHVPETLRLYEAKISKGGRIIWELAIAFSPRLSESAERLLECDDDQMTDQPVKGGKIYSEIIRVWDIVFDHDKISSSVQKIVKSHTRGETCIIQKKLKGVKHEKISDKTKRRFPRIFAETDLDLEEVKAYYPPASANETEYHILKFYSFSSNLVSHILQNIEIKVDFPFRVTDLEHAIINLKSNAPILLLGRSGTGKTTCCLYRLWSRFLWYWTKAQEAGAPLLPRCVIYREQDENKALEDGEEDEREEENDENQEDECCALQRQVSGGSSGASAVEENQNEAEDEVEELNGQQYDHLHQIFITKNAVLCNEVQKNFRELMHACDIAKNHVEAETLNLPNRLQDVTEYQFPLFVTSRQLLLMLDASLDPPYFFERTEDGSLKVDIQGWTDGDGPLSILPLLQENSDDEDESEDEDLNDEDDDEDDTNQDRVKRKKVDPRKEMTYELFSESIWPHMNKGIGKKYHPSLVWTEIMSFIKGSYEALSKPKGFLEKSEYLELGRKRAPNFSGEREHIYELFKRYEHARKQRFLFDETDLVRDIYHRVCRQQDMNWVIHQIFVDETQDFTQAELCLLLRLCQDPNNMFLTGDTAQSIMRGISFRFSDLKSLFFYASKSLQAMGKTSGVSIPKQVYQLTHNYRSHAGILSLASSILDLMIEFFPESFDRLNKDQGLFHGPQPVLLESCSFSDLALLLRGNKRKTSHIEFGAHQAILVVNDAARENVPEELQYGLILTIYEAKGLEFDDILLYNFFKDSQASKEWRVVTDFLERLCDAAQTETENLVQVSSELLQQKDRPRSLTFDPNQHKVLNSELKHLYTAVTRARVNVWIFDEDMEKRAPMFEYFRARQLVKAISSDDVQNISTGGMFAEESTPEEWIKRAQDFMKHNLYEVAAKCYRQGKDPYMEKVAMSHQTALKASRIKDNPAKMREEFALAAEQYLQIPLPVYAAKCLQNARERELLAHLFEKIGQLEKAAETYRKLRKPVESSACYERLGFFDKAVDTLYEHEMYDMAIDTLKRYTMQKKEFDEQGKTLPQHLKDHAPRKEHTEEQLAYEAAKMYHKAKNPNKMLASLNRLSSIQDRVNFLKEHHNMHNDYMKHAAKILRDSGQAMAAAQLYLDQGKISEALTLAREIKRKDLVGYCLIVEVRMAITVQEEGRVLSEEKDEVIAKSKEAFEIFKNLDQKGCPVYGDPQNGAGEASLLYGQLTDDMSWINLSWGAFNKANPFRNEAGQLDCMHWMVYNSDLTNRVNLYQVVKGMQNLYGVLKILIEPVAQDKFRLGQILRLYGLSIPTDKGLVMFNPQQKPRVLDVLKNQGTDVNEKIIKHEMPVNEVKLRIAKDLLNKGKGWYLRLQKEFESQCKRLSQCPLYSIGVQAQTEDKCCESKHHKLTSSEFRQLLEVELLYVLMDYFVYNGCWEISSLLSPELLEIQNSFYDYKNNDYASCKHLLSSVYNKFRQEEGIAISTMSEACSLKKLFGQKRYALLQQTSMGFSLINCRAQLERMLKHEYNYLRDKKNKKREKNAELFMNIVFIKNFFSITINLQDILRGFEHDLNTEYHNRIIPFRNLENLGFLVEKDTVHCVFRRFLEAYECLSSSNNNPEQALRKFSKFIQLERRRNHEPMLPDLGVMMLWIEFYTVVAFCLECRFTLIKNTTFVIPSTYLSIVNFVDSSFLGDNGVPTFEAINRYSPFHVPEQDLIRNRTERLVGILAGTDKRINIIRLAFHRMSESIQAFHPWGGIEDDQVDTKFEYSKDMIESITIAERVLVSSLVFLCNIDKTVFPDSETYVIRELCRIKLPDHCPRRLIDAVSGVQRAEGISDIVVCLKTLLEQRGEALLQCSWEPKKKKRHGIVPDSIVDMSIFSNHFYLHQTTDVLVNPDTIIASHSNDDDDEEIATTAEEREKVQAEQKAFEEDQKKKNSAQKILKFFRHVQFLSNCENLRELCEIQKLKERHSGKVDIFKDVIVNETMCGICGEYFKVEEGQIEKDLEEGRSDQLQVLSQTGPSSQPTSPESSNSVFSKLYSSFKGIVMGTESQPNPQPSYDQLPPGQHNLNFPSLAETTHNTLDGLTPLQKHKRSMQHLDKQSDFKMFKNKYIREFKSNVDGMKEFIDQYELRSPRAKQLYPDITLEISHVTASYDKVMQDIRKILDEKNWRDNSLHMSVKEMWGKGNSIYDYVLEWYSKQTKASTKKKVSVQKDTYEEDDYYEDAYEELEEVVQEPKGRMTFVNSKRKRKGKYVP